MLPFKGHVLHIPYGSYRPRQRETSYARKVIKISLRLHHWLPNVYVWLTNNNFLLWRTRLVTATYRPVSLSAHTFLFCFYPWPYILNVTLFTKNFVNIFSIAVQEFRNLFWKICPLFGQILITCLKCSRASSSLFSYSEKLRWDQGWPDIAIWKSNKFKS